MKPKKFFHLPVLLLVPFCVSARGADEERVSEMGTLSPLSFEGYVPEAHVPESRNQHALIIGLSRSMPCILPNLDFWKYVAPHSADTYVSSSEWSERVSHRPPKRIRPTKNRPHKTVSNRMRR